MKFLSLLLALVALTFGPVAQAGCFGKLFHRRGAASGEYSSGGCATGNCGGATTVQSYYQSTSYAQPAYGYGYAQLNCPGGVCPTPTAYTAPCATCPTGQATYFNYSRHPATYPTPQSQPMPYPSPPQKSAPIPPTSMRQDNCGCKVCKCSACECLTVERVASLY